MDCDVVSCDWLDKEYAVLDEGKLIINQVVYTALVVPECICIPQKAVDFILLAAKKGLPVYMVNSLPQGNEYEEPLPATFQNSVKVIPLHETAEYVRRTGNPAISLEQSHKNLRVSCYCQKDCRVYMLFNESPFDKIETEAAFLLEENSGFQFYDALTNTSAPAYEGEFDLDIAICRTYMLQLPKVGDCAEIWMNGAYAGMVISVPYSLDVTGLVKEGKNTLRIEVTNTLMWKMHDGQSTHMQHGPTGLLEPPVLHIYQ